MSTKTVCRLCGNENSTIFYDIYESILDKDSLSSVINIFCDIQCPEKGDGLSEKICRKCFLTLTFAKNLRLVAKRNDSNFRENLLKDQLKNALESLNDPLSTGDWDYLKVGDFEEEHAKISNFDQHSSNEEFCAKPSIVQPPIANGSSEPVVTRIPVENCNISKFVENQTLQLAKTSYPTNQTFYEITEVFGMDLDTDVRILKIELATGPPKETEYEKQLRLHEERKKRQREKPTPEFICIVCGKKFKSPRGLEKHESSHNRVGTEKKGPPQFSCDLCGKKLSTKSSVFCHMNELHVKERKHKCNYCEKTFYRTDRLKIHVISAHMDPSQWPHVCKICDNKRFITKASLKIHWRIHSGERPYACGYCKNTYIHYSDWNRHTQTHTGNFRYRCDICQKGFNRANILASHKRTHARSSKN